MEPTNKHELESIAGLVRTHLAGEFPAGMIEVISDDTYGWGVGIMLECKLDDVGDPENGPRLSIDPIRWAHVTQNKHTDKWEMVLYDYNTNPLHYEHGPKAVSIVPLGGDENPADIAEAVVVLFAALGVKHVQR